MSKRKSNASDEQKVVRTVHAKVLRIIYSRDGYFIFSFSISKHDDASKIGQIFTAKGNVPFQIYPGSRVVLTGTPVYDSQRDAWQLNIKSSTEDISDTDKAIRVLKEAKGVGDVKAKEIVDSFSVSGNSEGILERIAKNPRMLLSVQGINSETSVEVYNHVCNFLKSDSGLQKLYELNLTNHQIGRIHECFKTYSLDVIKARCFELTNLNGIGFLLASRIADAVGVPKSDPKRIEACILYYANEAMNNGSVCFDGMELINTVNKILGVSTKAIVDVFSKLVEEMKIAALNGRFDPTEYSNIIPKE